MKKEILSEEMLNDDQLKVINGGTCKQSRKDQDFCDKIGLMFNCTRLSTKDIFATAGIKYKQNNGFLGLGIRSSGNDYIYNGKDISQKKAWEILATHYGTTVDQVLNICIWDYITGDIV